MLIIGREGRFLWETLCVSYSSSEFSRTYFDSTSLACPAHLSYKRQGDKKCCLLWHGSVIICHLFRWKDKKGGRFEWAVGFVLGSGFVSWEGGRDVKWMNLSWLDDLSLDFWLSTFHKSSGVRDVLEQQKLLCCSALPTWCKHQIHLILLVELLNECPLFREIYCWEKSISWLGRGSIQSQRVLKGPL